MKFTFELGDSTMTIENDGSPETIPLVPGNAPQLPNGAVLNPPPGTYWHITGQTGGASLQGTHGPLVMPSGSTASFQTDSL